MIEYISRCRWKAHAVVDFQLSGNKGRAHQETNQSIHFCPELHRMMVSQPRSQQCSYLVVQHFVKGEVPPQWFPAAMCAMDRVSRVLHISCGFSVFSLLVGQLPPKNPLRAASCLTL